MLFGLFALAQVPGYLVDRRLMRQFVLLAVLIIDIQLLGKSLQYPQRPRRLSFSEHVDLQCKRRSAPTFSRHMG